MTHDDEVPPGQAAQRINRRSPLHKSGKAAALIVVGCALVAGCTEADQMSILNPSGPAAASISTIWWVMFWVAAVIFVVVIGLLLFVTIRATRRQAEHPAAPHLSTTPVPRSMSLMIAIGGIVVPAVVLAVLMVTSVSSGLSLAADADNELVVDVVGHEWWWEVRYTDPETGEEIVTANEVHIPVGEPITFRLESADVIHSFWVPELGGKIDMIPGATNLLELQADEPGTYRGICAEYCGIQHANMAVLVIAEEPGEFDEWLAAQAEPADGPTTEELQRGERAFLGAQCVYCHTIDGRAESAELGPDLTHFGSRQTIGSAMIENNRGNLAGWIMDPQGIKPGNHMPATNLDEQQLQDLLDYLESLQ